MTNVQGTWDFKWPQGTAIRIAFQELTASDASAFDFSLSDLITKYKEIANLWLAGKPNISFDFVEETQLAPKEQLNGVYNLRSPRGWLPVAYDVLVSFASTPAVIAGGDPVTLVTGQVSVLGSYAKRINHGTPTTLVGPNREFAYGRPLANYFDDPIFAEIVLHELGHVLGIPHQHQNPLYKGRPAIQRNAEVSATLNGIREKYWTKFSPEVDQEIRNIWPALAVQESRVDFSDWHPYVQKRREEGAENPTPRLERDSVMAHPIWSELTDLTDLQDRGPPHTKPTAFDFTLLGEMYPRV